MTDNACGDKAGTIAGYYRHRRRKEPACGPCLAANRERSRLVRRRQGATPRRKPRCGTPSGYTAHFRTEPPTRPCGPCRRAFRDYRRNLRRRKQAG